MWAVQVVLRRFRVAQSVVDTLEVFSILFNRRSLEICGEVIECIMCDCAHCNYACLCLFTYLDAKTVLIIGPLAKMKLRDMCSGLVLHTSLVPITIEKLCLIFDVLRSAL